jgi:hypothetical protein
MKGNVIMKEKISALADGELSEFETRRVLEEISSNPEYREFWRNIQLSKETFNEDDVMLNSRDLSEFLKIKLNKTKPKATKGESKSLYLQKKYLAASFVGFFAVMTYSLFPQPELSFYDQASEKLLTAIESPEAIEVLNGAVSGLNVKLQNLESNSKGTLASYISHDSGQTFKVSLYPIEEINKIGIIEASKISYIRSEDGVYVISISGDLALEKKNQILQRANFLLTK